MCFNCKQQHLSMLGMLHEAIYVVSHSLKVLWNQLRG